MKKLLSCSYLQYYKLLQSFFTFKSHYLTDQYVAIICFHSEWKLSGGLILPLRVYYILHILQYFQRSSENGHFTPL